MPPRHLAPIALVIALACDVRAPESTEPAGVADAVANAAAGTDGARGISLTKERSAAPPSAGHRGGVGAQSDATLTQSMILRSGSASIEVDSLDSAIGRLRALASALGGSVANTAIRAGRERTPQATIDLRLPAARFDEALAGLRPIGTVEQVHVTAEDVSEEYVDISARVANARRLEQRLIEVLAERTGKLGDVLQVERELARIREEIERYEGRLRWLRARAAMSTLSVTVHESLPVVGDQGSLGVLADAVAQAWRNFIALTALAIAAAGVVVPIALVGALAVLVAMRRRRPAEG